MVTNAMMRVLEVFHHMTSRWVVGIMARRGPAGECEYALVKRGGGMTMVDKGVHVEATGNHCGVC